MESKVFEVKVESSDAQIAASLKQAYRIFKAGSTLKDLPPYDYFEKNAFDSFFQSSFKLKIKEKQINVDEELSLTQDKYIKANRTAKLLDAKRKDLIALAIEGDTSIDEVLRITGYTPLNLETLLKEMKSEYPVEKVSELDALVAKQKSDIIKKKLIDPKNTKKIVNNDHQAWLNAFKELKDQKKRLREATAENAFNETGIDEDELEALKKKVDHWILSDK